MCAPKTSNGMHGYTLQEHILFCLILKLYFLYNNFRIAPTFKIQVCKFGKSLFSWHLEKCIFHNAEKKISRDDKCTKHRAWLYCSKNYASDVQIWKQLSPWPKVQKKLYPITLPSKSPKGWKLNSLYSYKNDIKCKWNNFISL